MRRNIYKTGFYITAVIGLWIYLLYSVDRTFDMWVNSDMATDMVLGKLLQERGGILSRDWYYTTELRVFNIQIPFKFFFEFTNNWHNVWVLSVGFWSLALIVSFGYLCWQIGCGQWFLPAVCFMIMPVSLPYYEIVILQIFYSPHVCIFFFAVGMLFHFQRLSNKADKRKWSVLVISVLLAFVSGCGGGAADVYSISSVADGRPSVAVI